MVKQNLSDQEKQEQLRKKAREIREEFFSTYIPLENIQEAEKAKKIKKVSWNEHMTVTSDEKILIDKQIGNEEAQREVQIYQITFSNVQRAIAYLTQEGISVERPNDFEVELFKSPKQMEKIQLKIVKKKEEKEKKEEQKMKKYSKKLNKQMKIRKIKEEQKEKKNNKAAIEQWKKEIKEKGSEKARDLDQIIKENNQKFRPNFKNKEKQNNIDGIRRNKNFKTKQNFQRKQNSNSTFQKNKNQSEGSYQNRSHPKDSNNTNRQRRSFQKSENFRDGQRSRSSNTQIQKGNRNQHNIKEKQFKKNFKPRQAEKPLHMGGNSAKRNFRGKKTFSKRNNNAGQQRKQNFKGQRK